MLIFRERYYRLIAFRIRQDFCKEVAFTPLSRELGRDFQQGIVKGNLLLTFLRLYIIINPAFA